VQVAGVGPPPREEPIVLHLGALNRN
jgi:hypothetical protein